MRKSGIMDNLSRKKDQGLDIAINKEEAERLAAALEMEWRMERLSKINQIKDAIANDDYGVDSSVVAKSLLKYPK